MLNERTFGRWDVASVLGHPESTLTTGPPQKMLLFIYIGELLALGLTYTFRRVSNKQLSGRRRSTARIGIAVVLQTTSSANQRANSKVLPGEN